MESIERRRLMFLGAGLGVTGVGAVLVGCGDPRGARSARDEKHEGSEEDLAPPEDLMREHGVLNRLLLVYEESVRRLEGGVTLPPEALASAAGVVRRFIEDYHEKLEEDFLFPRFEKAGKLTDLVATLRKQHQAGRRLTEDIQRLGTQPGLASSDGRTSVIAAIRSFVRMYRPHESREDTVLFPALRSVVSPKEFKDLGEQFEDREHALFGKEGFEGIVAQVARIEETLGIADLNQFTPS
jgi:hemerythrin-like domain-containing protein